MSFGSTGIAELPQIKSNILVIIKFIFAVRHTRSFLSNRFYEEHPFLLLYQSEEGMLIIKVILISGGILTRSFKAESIRPSFMQISNLWFIWMSYWFFQCVFIRVLLRAPCFTENVCLYSVKNLSCSIDVYRGLFCFDTNFRKRFSYLGNESDSLTSSWIYSSVFYSNIKWNLHFNDFLIS